MGEVDKKHTQQGTEGKKVFIPCELWAKRYYRKLTDNEWIVYLWLCYYMNIATLFSKAEIGGLEDGTRLKWTTITKTLANLEKKGFIKMMSLQLADDRNYREDTITVRIKVLR